MLLYYYNAKSLSDNYETRDVSQETQMGKLQTRWQGILIRSAVPLLILAALAWYARPDVGNLHIFFLDTPGDAIIIQTPDGSYVLIDGGREPSLATLNLGRTMPFWKRTLDAVILTRADYERLPGQVAALARYKANMALVPKPESLWQHDSLTREWMTLLTEQNTPTQIARPGLRFALGGMMWNVLAANDNDESGIVLQVEYGTTRVVFAGASTHDDTEELLATAQPITALAYPWESESDPSLMEAWQPDIIVYTTAHKDHHGALKTYAERARFSPNIPPAQLYHQRINGTVELVCTPYPRQGPNGQSQSPCIVHTEREW